VSIGPSSFIAIEAIAMVAFRSSDGRRWGPVRW
jgi:hypothetical protein